jgi:hypothetical protein
MHLLLSSSLFHASYSVVGLEVGEQSGGGCLFMSRGADTIGPAHLIGFLGVLYGVGVGSGVEVYVASLASRFNLSS